MLQSFRPLGLDQVCCQISSTTWTFVLINFFVWFNWVDGFIMQAVRSKQNSSSLSQDDGESEITGRVVGTVRRHIPIDTRDPPGAILHYYVGDSYDPSRQVFI